MASTYSALKFELIGTGEQSGTWGNTTNTNLGTAIEEAITGSANVAFSSGAVTLALTDTNTTQTARNLRLNLTGTSGGAQNLVVPSIEKFYLVNNGVADAITVKTSSGTGVAVPAGKAMLLFNDGTNVVNAVTHMSSITLTTALAVAQGGTGSTTASGARTNLGLGALSVLDQVNTAQIVADAVTNAKIADDAVDTENIADDAITAPLIDDLAVGTAALAADAVTNAKIVDGAVDTENIAADAITAALIDDLAVGTAALAAGAVTSAKIANDAVGATQLNVTGSGSSGELLSSDGDGSFSFIPPAAGGFSNMEVFTSTGTWTNPGSITKVKVTVIGGGGQGGGPTAPSPSGSPGSLSGGGGGGGTAIEVITIPTSPVPVTVGAGGPGAGGTSSFDTYCSATGGSQGSTTTPGGGPGGGGGVGSGGSLNIGGADGSPGAITNPATKARGGTGGPSFMGGGGQGHAMAETSPNFVTRPGQPGNDFGSGGGGAWRIVGGTGAPGVVIVEF